MCVLENSDKSEISNTTVRLTNITSLGTDIGCPINLHLILSILN